MSAPLASSPAIREISKQKSPCSKSTGHCLLAPRRSHISNFIVQHSSVKLSFHSLFLTGMCPASPVLQEGVKGHNMMKPPCRKAPPFRGELYSGLTQKNSVRRFTFQNGYFYLLTPFRCRDENIIEKGGLLFMNHSAGAWGRSAFGQNSIKAGYRIAWRTILELRAGPS